MKIDSDRLRTLRKRKRLSRPDLERASGINMRTIQRLENEPDKSKSTREDTVNRLADALEVEPDVLTGDLPLPELDDATVSEPDPVRIGAQIPPKVRLAYDLIKRRYGVNATDVITMAPLFFALLAEGSLAWRREKRLEASESFERLEELEGYWCGSMADSSTVIAYGMAREDESVSKADLFGEHLCNNDPGEFGDSFFDPSIENPFATYVRKMGADLGIPGIVDVDGGELGFGSPAEFPDYDIWNDEIERIANGSTDGRRALETGFARLSEIPDQVMSEAMSDERQKLLEDSLPDFYRGAKEEDLAGEIARRHSLLPKGDEFTETVKKLSGKTNSPKSDDEGDDQ